MQFEYLIEAAAVEWVSVVRYDHDFEDSDETAHDVNEDFCVWCGQATSRDAVEEIKAEEQDLRDSILKLIKEDPELLDDIERAQDALTVFENRPDLLEDAERFREALSDG